MRARLAVLGAVMVASGCGGSGTTTTTGTTKPSPPPGPPPPATVTAGAVKVTLYPGAKNPKANAKWRYRIRVTDTKGKKMGGKITVQIVDPLGQPHAVTYDDTKRVIKNFPFSGDFRDYVEYPPDARGFTLTFRATAKTAKGTVTISYPVTPT
jgi:hypothetical protein